MPGDFDLSSYTLFERQSMFFNGYYCPYCKCQTELVESSVIHQENHGLIFYCRKCDASVGTVDGDRSLGCLAKKPLRDLRRYCHKVIEELVEKKVSFGKIKQRTARIRMYKWIAGLLNITKLECHVAYWNEAQCKKVIEECKKHVS